jgi:hypothetical protein
MAGIIPNGQWLFGGGVIVELPTISDKNLGSNVWGMGPASVAVRTAHPGVYGALANTVFSLGGTSGPGGTSYVLTTINPFINYNFEGGWFIGTSPISTANWNAPGEKWTLPVGGQFGRLIKIGGKLPVNLLVGAYYCGFRRSQSSIPIERWRAMPCSSRRVSANLPSNSSTAPRSSAARL